MRCFRFLFSVLVLLPLLAAAPAHAGPGEKLYEEFVENEELYPEQDWQTYVQNVGERLVAHSDDPNGEFHFYVLDNPSVNAFALPDGYIFVNRGLLAYLRSEDQLAAVLGHEIGHVTAHHARKRNVTAAFGNIVGFIGAVMTGRGELLDLSNTATATIVSGYGREMELEADEIGGKLLAKSGYNPLAMIEVIQALKDDELFSTQVVGEPQNYHGLFASHPKNDKRLHDAVEEAMGIYPEELAPAEGDFWALMDGLIYGTPSAGGTVKDHTYYNMSLRLVVEFPEGWDIDAGSSRILARAPGGSAEGFIELMRQNRDETETPEAYLRETLKRDDVGEGETIEVNESPVFIVEAPPLDQQTAASWLAVMFKDNTVYYFKGETEQASQAASLAEKFRATVESVRNLTAADARIANDQRIKVIVAEPTDSYASLGKESPLERYPEQTLRLINGDHPNGEPRAGDHIKIVE